MATKKAVAACTELCVECAVAPKAAAAAAEAARECSHVFHPLRNDVAVSPAAFQGGRRGQSATERQADASAVLAHVRHLGKLGGHDVRHLARIGDAMQAHVAADGAGGTSTIASGFSAGGGGDAAQHEAEVRRRELKNLVLEILNEARATTPPSTPSEVDEVAAQLRQELDYESAAFKIIVRSSERSPVEPARVLSASRSSGSGFMVDAERMLVVTNGHVVRGADAVFVLSALAPRTQVRADVVQVCYDLDIALVRIRTREAAAAWGDRVQPRAFKLCAEQRDMFVHKLDRRLKLRPAVRSLPEQAVGAGGGGGGGGGAEKACSGSVVRLQRVFAVGYPLGSSSVQISQGIVSGFEGISDELVIQTTAPISHGNSGGALLNVRGEVVGVTSSGIPSGENIGFAIPAATVRSVLDVFYSGRYALHRVLIVPELGIEFASGSSIDAATLPRITKTVGAAPATPAAGPVYAFDEKQEAGSAAGVGSVEAGELLRAAGEASAAEKPPPGVFVTQLDPLHAFATPLRGEPVGASGGGGGSGDDDEEAVAVPARAGGELSSSSEATAVQPFDLVTHFNGFELSNEGVTSERTYPRSISLTLLYRALPFLSEYTVRFWRRGIGAFANRYAFEPVLPVRDYDVRRFYREQFEDSSRLVRDNTAFDIGGQVRFVQLSLNLVESAKSFAPWLARYEQAANRTRPRLVVLADARGALRPLDVVTTVDGKEVGTRDQLLDLLRAKAERNERYMLIQTELGSMGVVSAEPERDESGSAGSAELMRALAAVLRAAKAGAAGAADEGKGGAAASGGDGDKAGGGDDDDGGSDDESGGEDKDDGKGEGEGEGGDDDDDDDDDDS